MKTSSNEQVSSNIPDTGFGAFNTEHYRRERTVSFNTEADFTLSPFSIRQCLLGELTKGEHHSPEEMELFRKLTAFILDGTHNEIKQVDNQWLIHLRRIEVLALRKWLEARMKHCEEERDQRIPLGKLYESAGKVARAESSSDEESQRLTNEYDGQLRFNPDTYIAQKFLLLDIREWLLGDIVE